ncbi:hypothetical protein Acr_06g0015670 [Actinidia rufa]|uniref:Uncharacterized protein n=1 Tax=Actinidia rufa TaxID=165716 RepID=A0A7J0EVL0_9ERIC|nr:hypothetical protein Acr_06g0015670 [Actinidia rufa]
MSQWRRFNLPGREENKTQLNLQYVIPLLVLKVLNWVDEFCRFSVQKWNSDLHYYNGEHQNPIRLSPPSTTTPTPEMLLSRAQELTPFTLSLSLSSLEPEPEPEPEQSRNHSHAPGPHNPPLSSPTLRHHHRRRLFHSSVSSLPHPNPLSLSLFRSKTRRLLALPLSNFVAHVADETDSDAVRETGEFSKRSESDGFDLDASFESTDLKWLKSPLLEVQELGSFRSSGGGPSWHGCARNCRRIKLGY